MFHKKKAKMREKPEKWIQIYDLESSDDPSDLSGDPLEGPEPIIGNHWTKLA